MVWRLNEMLGVLQKLVLFLPLAMPTMASQLAIVIDDIGYRKEDSAIFELPKEVTVAIIPVAPYANARANQAFTQGRDVLIHLPMQPSKPQPIESGALMIGMNDSEVSELIHSAKRQVPHAIGLNNHMGSGATQDKATMQALMKALATEKLFFLDSKTIGSSIAAKTAQESGINALERDLFLDDSDALNDVQRQFQAAISFARKHGRAILIGHPRKNSVKVLQQGIQNLPNDIELVSLSVLWQHKTPVPQPAKPFIMLFDFEAPTSVAPFESVPLLRGVPKD